MSVKLTITPAETAAERKIFAHFPWKVYCDDPYWVPPFPSEREAFLDPERHPFHRHAEVRYFVARRGDAVVGTVAGIVNHNHNRHWDDRVGFFGLFEVLDDREAAEALLEAAETFVRGAGMEAIRGPMNFSTNEECGLLVEGWNGPPVVLLTYNPRYYVDFIAGAGYVKAQDLYAYHNDLTRYRTDGSDINPKVLRVAEKVNHRLDITVRPIDMRRFDEEANLFKEIYNAAWAKNWGFIPYTGEEMEHEIKALRPILDPGVIFFAEKAGKTVGAMLPLPDINQALHHAYPRPGTPDWWTTAKMLYWWKVRRRVTTIRAFAGGVVADYRGRGVDAVLFLEAMRAGLKRGYKQMEISWVLESNTPMRRTAEVFGGEIYRTYRVYEKGL